MARQDNINSIVIAGGGTAGWMTAAALSAVLPPHLYSITLIESDEIGAIGVGEATIPPIQLFNRLAQVDESAFIKATGATFKLGIEFANWRTGSDRYFHPFGRYGDDFGAAPFHQHWLRAHALGDPTPISEYSLATKAAYAGKFRWPDTAANTVYSTLGFAYHFDALRYGKYLRSLAEMRGVERREGKIVDVRLTAETGYVESLRLSDGGELTGDLFIDCTGLRALLIGEALGVDYQEWSRYLPCNRALAVPTDVIDLDTPYTRATAHAAGWQWRIPLQHRLGNGMVYCDGFWSEDEAARALLGNLDGDVLADPRPIRFRTGRRERFWEKNCIAIGLSAGFLEPLESTSIHLIQTSITRLLGFFPTRSFDPLVIGEYNRHTTNEYDRTRDFLVLHYHATERSDSEFWNHCRTMPIPETLAEKLDMFRGSGRLLKRDFDLFQDASWLAVMLGQGVRPKSYDPLTESVPPLDLDRALRGMRVTVARAAEEMPPHARFISQFCSAAPT
ncbi:tryptophan 7-halogenase [Sphingomonas oligophenolica]|uniref:Tryptophan halogenase family protein n=1 Tax=Sphingomonas oligophenolica TaxID=301154 RepID=A0ABU9Y7A1_9SPHN